MADAPYLPVPAPAFGRLPAGATPTLAGWLVETGEPVRRGERVAELTIPGLTVDALSPADGVLVRQNVAAGRPIDTDEPLGWVERTDD
ncbi:lipoyl domain-containing protein [Alienimonas sp. DA493]|uniref:lipoyl domain-containing protein n=1 Tax=Alienimonas sp. DA493 TaxID=3373605 RepID=UPI0037553CA1